MLVCAGTANLGEDSALSLLNQFERDRAKQPPETKPIAVNPNFCAKGCIGSVERWVECTDHHPYAQVASGRWGVQSARYIVLPHSRDLGGRSAAFLQMAVGFTLITSRGCTPGWYAIAPLGPHLCPSTEEIVPSSSSTPRRLPAPNGSEQTTRVICWESVAESSGI